MSQTYLIQKVPLVNYSVDLMLEQSINWFTIYQILAPSYCKVSSLHLCVYYLLL